MKNWFYTFYNEKSHSQVIGAISTPPFPGITFAMVREQIIRPYLIKQGISNPVNLTYERAKNAAQRTPIIEASEITPSININGTKYSTLTGYAEKKPKESIAAVGSDKVRSSPVKPKEPIVNTSPDKAERTLDTSANHPLLIFLLDCRQHKLGCLIKGNQMFCELFTRSS